MMEDKNSIIDKANVDDVMRPSVPEDDEEILHISDVIDVIRTDLDLNAVIVPEPSTMFNNNNSNSTTVPYQIPVGPIQQRHLQAIRRNAYVQILEQPASKALRFRYECEGRSAGSIPGASSTPENKTFPSIQVVGYKGRAHVVVSCVTKDVPYRPHPHNLVGREGCKRGVCSLEIPPETMTISFSNLGIQCVKKKDIENALRVREEIKVDPYKTGFNHRTQPTSIDLNSVRLCFQVFLEGDCPGKYNVPLNPIVSDPIYDKKAMSDLVITKLSHCNCYADGGRNDIILLCEKVAKEDIQVRFFEELEGHLVWEGFAEFQPSQVHKQTAIWFRPPKYHNCHITESRRVQIQLRRPSDGAQSDSLPFEYLPTDCAETSVLSKRKRQKIDDHSQFLKQLEEYDKNRGHQRDSVLYNIPVSSIKHEPIDKSPSPYQSPNMLYTDHHYNSYHPHAHHHHHVIVPPSASTNQEMAYNYLHQAPSQLEIIPVPNPITSSSSSNHNSNNPNWMNMPSTSTAANHHQFGAGGGGPPPPPPPPPLEHSGGLSSLLDLDSQQMELKQIHLNSGDLAFDSINNNMSLSDLDGSQNVTDSLSRFVAHNNDDILLDQ